VLDLLLEKLKESTLSVIPIIIMVFVLGFTIAPMPLWSLILFLVSAIMMILGITLFNLGVDVSLIPIGKHIGSSTVKSKKLLLIIVITFIIGVFISVAEPDLIVLAGQINGVPDSTIILSVAVGVGIALVAAFLRILFQFPLSYLLIGCYAAGENFDPR
jgi:membrane-associated HD superfamily phosphohydrolase